MMYQHDTTGETLSRRALQDRLGASFPRDKPPAGWSIKTPPAPTLDDLQQRKRSDIVQARKAAERQGVTVQGVRYAGDADNRRDMKEALDGFQVSGQTAVQSWKDSDGKHHRNHPVSDVHNAYFQILIQRQQFIAREGELMAQIDAAETQQDLDAITWQE